MPAPLRPTFRPLIFTAKDETDTQRLASIMTQVLRPGTNVGLIGNLGAGKTRFVQMLTIAMGGDTAEVTSPTFVLVQEYEGQLSSEEGCRSIHIFHFDAYRLKDIDEFLELGAEEMLYAGGICLIEWADRVEEALPRDRVCIEIHSTGETERQFTISGTGPESMELVNALSALIP